MNKRMIHWSIRTETPSWILSTIKDDWSLSVLRNAFTRILQILLVLTASRAFYLRSSSQFFLPPPPSNKLSAYVLYIISVFTVFILYLFVISQCCCARIQTTEASARCSRDVVLPMNGPGGRRPEHRGQQANLIVDPTAFRHSENEDGLEEVRRRLSIRRSRIIRRGLAYSMVLLTMACRSFLVEDDEGGKVDVAGFKI